MRLKDKVAIVTGGGAGIGKAIAAGFAKEGAKVVITDINEDRLKKSSEEIKSQGSDVLAFRSDVSVMKDIKRMVEKTMERFGKIDILVNNAAMQTPAKIFWEREESVFDNVVKINLKGLYFCTQAVVKTMLQRNYGKIVNIASSQGRIGLPMNSDYATTKGAVISLTRTLAVELGPMGINVNGICPGLTPTEGMKAVGLSPEITEAVINMTPLRRMGKPEDYVGISVFLASDESSFMTGQTVSVDGGISMP
ncbi:MAG: SDR family oxidoreductase [Proteobacteria bacterium]|nr:SDR family oxidoreductase [Pseudomonadota bacterium]MBU4009907.1 SDR family oxidoreductase [Pseudomonadota bacterium]